MKKVPVGNFEPLVDGKLNGELPPVGSWIEVLWPDLTITTHKVISDDPQSGLRYVTIEYHGFKLVVFLCGLPHKARYVQWVQEDEKPQESDH